MAGTMWIPPKFRFLGSRIAFLFTALLVFCFAAAVPFSRADSLVREGEVPEKLCEGFQWAEGPVFHPDGYLLFSDMPQNAIMKYDHGKLSVYRKKMSQPNGLALDAHGRLYVCQHGKRRVVRISKRGRMSVLAKKFKGKRLNSPNDLVIRSDGGLYFTDHGSSRHGKEDSGETGRGGVYYLPSDGALSLASGDFARPNGLALSPDEKRLYINDTERSHIRVFDIGPDGSLSGGAVFASMDGGQGVADGMETDEEGNVYSSGPGGLWIFNAAGTFMEKLEFPEPVSNMAWGDDGKSLYVTCGHSLYRVKMRTGKSS